MGQTPSRGYSSSTEVAPKVYEAENNNHILWGTLIEINNGQYFHNDRTNEICEQKRWNAGLMQEMVFLHANPTFDPAERKLLLINAMGSDGIWNSNSAEKS